MAMVRKSEPGKSVLIIVENLPLPLDRRVWQEANTLAAAGYQVSIICPKGKGYTKSYEQLAGIHIHRHPLPAEASGLLGYVKEYSAALFWELWLAIRIYRQRGFDVIQACNPPDIIFIVALLFRPFGVKFIFDHHDINPELFAVKFNRKGMLHRALLLLERLTFASAHAVISTNESYRKIALQRGGKSAEQVFIVRSGPDLQRLKVSGGAPKYRRPGEVVVGYVGVMGRQDGIDGLLRVAKLVLAARNYSGVRFLLVGGGTELEQMKKYAVELAIADWVVFSGFLLGEELINTLNEFDIGVCPDEFNEYNDKCTMNKIMEYMALGKPVVQYDLTEGRFTAGDAALYAQTHDEAALARQICKLIDDGALRTSMGEIGMRRISEKFSWQHEEPNLLAAYDYVCGRG